MDIERFMYKVLPKKRDWYLKGRKEIGFLHVISTAVGMLALPFMANYSNESRKLIAVCVQKCDIEICNYF